MTKYKGIAHCTGICIDKNSDNGHKPANSGNTCNSAALCPLCSPRVSVISFGTIILVICKVGGVLLSKRKKHVCAVRVSFLACYYHVVDVWLKHHEKSVQLFSKNKIAILLVKIRKKTVIGSDTIPYIDMYYFIKCLINISNFICAERENLIFFKTDKTTRQYFFL